MGQMGLRSGQALASSQVEIATLMRQRVALESRVAELEAALWEIKRRIETRDYVTPGEFVAFIDTLTQPNGQD